nr:MAG TPA: hypothetical protein [Caudoviricetes sp.]
MTFFWIVKLKGGKTLLCVIIVYKMTNSTQLISRLIATSRKLKRIRKNYHVYSSKSLM